MALDRIGRADEIGDTAVFQAASDPHPITGQTLSVNGGDCLNIGNRISIRCPAEFQVRVDCRNRYCADGAIAAAGAAAVGAKFGLSIANRPSGFGG